MDPATNPPLLNKWLKPFVMLLRQGMTPEKLALSLALGLTLGIFPVLGSTAFLCAGAGWVLGLNQPAIHSVNMIAYPLQLGLLIPFFRLGEWVFQTPPLVISLDSLHTLIQAGLLDAIHVLWDTTWHAIVAWALVAPTIAMGIYFVTLPAFRRLVVK